MNRKKSVIVAIMAFQSTEKFLIAVMDWPYLNLLKLFTIADNFLPVQTPARQLRSDKIGDTEINVPLSLKIIVMEIVFAGIAFIIVGILLLLSIRKNGGDSFSGHNSGFRKTALSRFVERIEELKINRRNYIQPEQLSGGQKVLLEQTYRRIKRIIAYVLLVTGFLFLLC